MPSGTVRVEPASAVEDSRREAAGAAERLVDGPDGHLYVHDCMGVTLRIEDTPWGVLTLDTLQPGRFDAIDGEVFVDGVVLHDREAAESIPVEARDGAAASMANSARRVTGPAHRPVT